MTIVSRRDHTISVDSVLASALLLAAFVVAAGTFGCGGSDPVRPPVSTARTWHTSPDGSGSDCGTPQECLDAAAAGDTIEFAGGTYDAVADTLVDDGMGGTVTANLVSRRTVILRGAAGADVRVNGMWRPGSVGLAIPAGDDTIEIRGIRFDNCDAGVRVTGAVVRVDSCEFVSGQHGIVAYDATLDIRGSMFMEYAAEGIVLRNCAGRMTGCEFWGNNYGGFVASARNFRFENTLVAFCCLTGLRIEEGGTVTLSNVTVTGVGMVPDDSTGVVVAGGARVTFERCIVARNRGFGIECRTGGSVDVRCSDVFNHSSGNYVGCADPTGTLGNLSVDPGFCAQDDLDFHLRPDSPARLAACGAMGAFGADNCRPLSRPSWRRPGRSGGRRAPG